MKQHQHQLRILAVIAIIVAAVSVGRIVAVTAQTADPSANGNLNANVSARSSEIVPSPAIDELNAQIEEKRKQVDELKRQAAIYQQQLEQQQGQRAVLSAELDDLRDSIQQTTTELQLNQAEVEQLQLEIQKVERDITDREAEIVKHQDSLGALLRRVYESDQVTNLELLVQEQSFSGFFTRVQQLHDLSASVDEELTAVREAKAQLDAARDELVAKRNDLDAKRDRLESSQNVLQEQESYQSTLVAEAKYTETQYQSLLGELKSQASSVDSEITGLIQQVNDRLAARGEQIDQAAQLTWPVDPSRGITAYFHDPDYPFRKIFEHPAIDIRAAHGTTVVAAADGVVAIARKLDWVRDSKGRILYSAYNFVTIVHSGGVATVYGHLSVVSVSEGQTVKRGDVIGKSGATPGTAGAGRLTTGPHLHFEVRVNGIPDDPLKYLPPLL